MLPAAIVPRLDLEPQSRWPSEDAWERAARLELRRSEDATVPEQATEARLGSSASGFVIRFDCDDRDIWSTHLTRNAALWEEEVVEVFIAPGRDDPREYFEVEVNPAGTIFAARVRNPEGRRETMTVDTTWQAPGLRVRVARPNPGQWRAEIALSFTDLGEGRTPRDWRANLFRIERPRDGHPEFSAWSPTRVRPADFHKPASFGMLTVAGE